MEDKFNGSIYKIENIHNHKCYIGSTTRGTAKRFLEHLKDKNYIDDFHVDLRRNPDNYNVTTLETNISTKIKLLYLETYYIGLFNSYENGFNKVRFNGDYPDNIPEHKTKIEKFLDELNEI